MKTGLSTDSRDLYGYRLCSAHNGLVLFIQFQKSSSTSKLLTQGSRYHKLRKIFGKFLRSYSKLMSKFGAKSFQENISEGISHPVFYSDLVYKLKRTKGTANFVSSDSKIVYAFDVENMTK